MGLINFILKSTLKRRISQIQHTLQNPLEVQLKLLMQLIKKSKDTEWGKKYDYASITTLSDFKNRVPISSYEDIFPIIERALKGEQNLLWPTNIRWFSKSSGTTNAKSKFIPVSKESLQHCHYKGGKDLLSLYFNNNPESKLFDGRGLGIGGSFKPNNKFKNSYYGDVSAVIMANLPIWAQYVRTPDIETALMSEWEEKLEKIAQRTLRQNVTNISGVPTWTVVLIERMLELSGKKNMLEIWPNFEVFFHGAVSFTPYRQLFKNFFPSNQVQYVETYNASEGFFGIQDRLGADDMLLMLDYGVFYEFLPASEVDNEATEAISLDEVQLNKNYAIIITTNAGLWRYKIGDTIKFTSKDPYRFKITGRTKHFINAFGEELIIENAESAIAEACGKTGSSINNFTAAPIFLKEKNKGGHEWIIEFINPPESMETFVQIFDKSLMDQNSDYEAKRYKDLALEQPTVHSVPEGTFYKWMKRRGKIGGQHKVPRLSNSREYVEDILELIISNNL